MKDRVLNVLADVNEDILGNEDKDLIASNIIDSFDIVNIVVGLEEEFEIEIDPELIVVENFSSVQAIVDMLASIIGE